MTDRSIEFHPEALLEARAAVAWYAERSLGAAEALMTEIDCAIEKVATDPYSWAEFAPGLRRVLFKRFPFSLVYQIASDKIQVIAVAHARRRPGYWKLRST